MIKWSEPTYLWLLLLVPVAAGAAIVSFALRRRRLTRAIDARLVAQLSASASAGLTLLKQLLLIAALAFLLLSAARPKWGEKLQLYKGRGIDVVIALDASKSMYAEDVKPNRLARAKAELSALIDGLSGNAVAVTAFAGDCYVMCPLTTDLEAAKMFLDIINPEAMPVPGTDFGRAIDVSSSLFNPQEKNYKALILITDGEDMGKNTPQAVERAAQAGIRIFPVAFSTPEGSPIPEYDEQGNLKSYKKDKDGQTVMSRMNERQLILIARATEGRFLRAEGFSVERLRAELDAMQKKEIGGGAYAEYVERYQMFLIIALVLFLAGLGLSNRRGSWLPRRSALGIPSGVRNPDRGFRGRPGFRASDARRSAPGGFGSTGTNQQPKPETEKPVYSSGTLRLSICLLACILSPALADVGGLMRKGNGLYARQKYEEALEAYQQAEVLEPDATAIHYNLGNALYRLNKYQEAVSELELVLTDKNPQRRANAMYNIGNTMYRAGQLDNAIKSYITALVLNPSDKQAKENLEFCLKQKEEQQHQPDSSRQNQQQNQQQQPQPRPQPQMSQDQAERVLQAVENKEKDQQAKKQQARQKRQVEKDW